MNTSKKRSGKALAGKQRCPSCGYETTLRGSTHETRVVGETCEEEGCDAPIVTSCTVGPGHIVVVCEDGHPMHGLEKRAQPCPQCGQTMYVEESHPSGRYLYRCAADAGHVKIEATCAKDPDPEETEE